MWSLISPRAKGISGPEKFWSSPRLVYEYAPWLHRRPGESRDDVESDVTSREHLVQRRFIRCIGQFGMGPAQCFHLHAGIDFEDLPGAADPHHVDRTKADADSACCPDRHI